MPVIIQEEWYKREVLRANPEKYYVFGDNYAQQGYGGQAKECRDEPNAIGIPTKKIPTMDEDAFLSDAEYEDWFERVKPIFQLILKHIQEDKTVIFPIDGLGTGYSELPERAPKIAEKLDEFLRICLHAEKLRARVLARNSTVTNL